MPERPTRRTRTLTILHRLAADPACKTMTRKEFIAHVAKYGVVEVECYLCRGSGKIVREPCVVCRGAGTVLTSEATA